MALSLTIKAQTGATCSEADVISSVPYYAAGLTTVGTAYNSLPCSGSGLSNYMSGKDYVFVFTPQQTANYLIKITNTSPSVGLFVTDLCPDDPSVQCIANNNAIMGNPQLTVNLQAGNTYYIIISSINFTTPQTNFNIEIQACTSTPTAAFTYIQNGLTVEFTNISQDAVSYLWYFGDELLPPPFSSGDTTTNPTHQYPQYGDYEVTLIAYNACGQTDTLRDTISVICPGNLPQATFSYTINGLTVSFTNESIDATSYGWFFGDELFPVFPSDTTPNPTHTYNQYGTYNVTLVAQNECGTDTFTISITLDCPGNLPVASFTYDIQPNGTVVFTSTSSDATQWEWFFGDSDIFPFLPGDTIENPTHTYLMSGTYTVNLIVYNECGSDTVSQTITITITSVPNNKLESLKLFPNPVDNDVINVQGIASDFTYTIFDSKGNKLIESISKDKKINVTNLCKGYYLIEIRTNDMVKLLPFSRL